MSERRVQMWIRRRPLQQVPSLGNWIIVASLVLPAKWAGIARVVVLFGLQGTGVANLAGNQVREPRLHINVNDFLSM